MFIGSLFTVAKTWKQPKYQRTDDQIKKQWYIYTRLLGTVAPRHYGRLHGCKTRSNITMRCYVDELKFHVTHAE